MRHSRNSTGVECVPTNPPFPPRCFHRESVLQFVATTNRTMCGLHASFCPGSWHLRTLQEALSGSRVETVTLISRVHPGGFWEELDRSPGSGPPTGRRVSDSVSRGWGGKCGGRCRNRVHGLRDRCAGGQPCISISDLDANDSSDLDVRHPLPHPILHSILVN